MSWKERKFINYDNTIIAIYRYLDKHIEENKFTFGIDTLEFVEKHIEILFDKDLLIRNKIYQIHITSSYSEKWTSIGIICEELQLMTNFMNSEI